MIFSLNQNFGASELALLAAAGELETPRRSRRPARRRARRSERRR
jgi:hypothetical protein